ncbi:MAG: sel1 repeat family protein [Polyangiaceae bacterium]|nr:sel1 repeat family protein [Polyangiaceae bacterium]
MTPRIAALLPLPLTLSVAACGPTPPAVGARNQPTVAEATGHKTTTAVSGPAEPMIVDWDPQARADLEAAMKSGVAVVAFNENGLELLKDCKVDGQYGFVGVTTKYQMVQLENSAEVQANLPLAGATIIAKLGAEFGQSKTLDVAMALVGKKRTTWRHATREDLQGSCDGATHIVRGATVGAFVLETGTKGEQRASAELFGAGAGQRSTSSKSVHNADGSLDACKLATSESSDPPSQCAALIRLELDPIRKDGGPRPAKAGSAGSEERAVAAGSAPQCPAGMVLAEGKCTTPESAKTHLCAPDDLVDCDKQCAAGHADSCNNLAVMQFQGKGTPADPAKADATFKKACDAGSTQACVNLAIRLYQSNPAESARLGERACAEGQPLGCEIAGEHHHLGHGVPVDTRKALRYYKAACDGGDQSGCTNTGLLYAGAAADIPKNEALGIRYTSRACDGGVSTACGNLGLKYEFGVVVQKDPKRAVELFARACRMSGGADCLRIAVAYQAGFGVKADDRRAKELFDVACSQPEYGFGAMGCAVLNMTYGEARPLPRASLEQIQPIMQPQCEQDVPRACTFLGVAHLALGKKSSGEMYLGQGCKANDYWACDLKRRLKIK